MNGMSTTIRARWCPYHVAGRCTAREGRPLACRTYFCDTRTESVLSEAHEHFLRRLRAIEREHAYPASYAEFPRLLAARGVPGLSRAMSRLQFQYVPAGEEESETFECYQETDKTVILPRQFGLSLWPVVAYEHGRIRLKDVTSMPAYDPIILRPHQGPWVDDVLRLFRTCANFDVVAAAPTGKGKTVMAIEIARRLGLETLIIVDQENLKDQWIERLNQHLGIHSDYVGVFQGKTRKESTCGFTVALIQSLYNKGDSLKDWLSQFGTTILDEIHGVGAPQFSQVLFMIPSRYRLGISATPDRRDSFDKVLKWHMGPTKVRMLDRHDESVVRVVENYTTTSWYANTSPKSGRYITELSEDPERNWMIVEIVRWFVEHERRAIIMSDRIEHFGAKAQSCKAFAISFSNPATRALACCTASTYS